MQMKARVGRGKAVMEYVSEAESGNEALLRVQPPAEGTVDVTDFPL